MKAKSIVSILLTSFHHNRHVTHSERLHTFSSTIPRPYEHLAPINRLDMYAKLFDVLGKRFGVRGR